MKQYLIVPAATFLLAFLAFPFAAALAESGASPVLRATLANGLRVVIVTNRLAPVVTTQLNYLAGSNDAPEGFPGTAHALEHMMFRGGEGLDKDQLAELEANLGGEYNAETSETVTRFSYSVPAYDLPIVLRIEALRMRGLSLNQADWEKERGAIEQEVSQDLSNPLYNFTSQAQAILFEHTPYEHDALGTRPSFDRTDTALLRQFYDKWYWPNNAILVIVGDVDPQRALAQVRTEFGDIPYHDLPAHPVISPLPVAAKTLALQTAYSLGLIGIGYRMPGLNQHDFAAADILGDVLGSERGSLYAMVAAGKTLAAQFSYQPKADVGFGVVMTTFPTGTDPTAMLADTRRVIADIVKDGVSPDLVAASRRLELAQLAFNSNSISGLADNWSRALTLQGTQSPDDVAQAYASVTVDDVNRLARTLLDPDHAVTAILTPREAGSPVAGGGFGGAESLASLPEHPVALPPWASAAAAIPPVPDLGNPASDTMLANGLRLIVQPEHVSPTVTVFGHVRQVPSMQEPPGKQGVASLMQKLFNYGTEVRDRVAYREAVDNIAAQTSTGTSFSLQVSTAEFAEGMRLLAENELHPAFPADSFKVVRSQLAQAVAGRLHTPDYQFRLAFYQALVPEGDPTLRMPTSDSVMSVQPEDLRGYFDATMRPDLTTIVVIGDVTVEQAREVVDAAFGKWQAIGKTPAVDLPPVGLNKPSYARITDESALQDTLSLAETIPVPVASPDRYTLTLGNAILGDGFPSRLYQDLRIRSGIVYSVTSALQWERTRTYYGVSFGADTENIAKARALIIRDIRSMQAEPVGEAELARAKSQLLCQLLMSRASIAGLAREYLRLVDLGLPLNDTQTAAARYHAIDASDIQQAFTAWIRPDDLAQIAKGPPR